MLVVQSSDVLQYVWGKLLGRHKIAPLLSPSKTVEGFVGGVASATLLGAALWWITPFSPWQAGADGAVINLMGFCGGLVMSAIKRDRGVKDWGQMIEGHGGMLDRLDFGDLRRADLLPRDALLVVGLIDLPESQRACSELPSAFTPPDHDQPSGAGYGCRRKSGVGPRRKQRNHFGHGATPDIRFSAMLRIRHMFLLFLHQ